MKLFELCEKDYRKFTESHNAHFLQSYEWGELAKNRDFIPYYIGLIDNNKIIATALLLQKKLLFGYTYFYIPRSYTIDYTNFELIKIFTLEIKKFCKSKKGIFFRIDPDIKLHTIDENANKLVGEDNYKLVNYLVAIGFTHRPLNKYFEGMQPRFTFRIDLKNSLEDIEKRYSNTTIQRIKKASRMGIEVEVGNKEDISEFIRLMKMTEQRQGFYSHNEKYYYLFYDLFQKKDFVTLYLGKVDIVKTLNKLKDELKKFKSEYLSLKEINNKKSNNRKKELEKNIKSLEEQINFFASKDEEKKIISAYLIVHYGNKSWALYAANDMEYKKLYANYLVYQKQIADSKLRGMEIFDVFGTIGEPNSDNHLVGLHDFKKKWGGEYTEFIGEFDYVLNKLMYFVYIKLIPIRHKIINKKLRKGVN